MSGRTTIDPCPVCQGRAMEAVTERNQLAVVRCATCGHRFVWPVPSAEALARIYDREYYRGGRGSMGFTDYGALAPARRRMFARHLARIERTRAPGRVLDVGCATGDFLQVARRRGWDALGVDPSPAREVALRGGLRLVGTTVHDAQVDSSSLDLVTFWDVLEHVPDPVADLRRAASLLAPRGVIAITVPDSGSLVARLSGARWFGYKTAGEHLQFFTAATLRQTFLRAGLELLVREPVAWSCTVGFVVDRAALYLGAPGRLLKAGLGRTPLTGWIVDVPQVNQFALARRGAGRVTDLAA